MRDVRLRAATHSHETKGAKKRERRRETERERERENIKIHEGQRATPGDDAFYGARRAIDAPRIRRRWELENWRAQLDPRRGS